MQLEIADFTPVPSPGELYEAYTLSLILFILSIINCDNMTSPTKHQVHDVPHCRQRRIEPRPQVTCTENLVKFGRVSF